MCVQQKRNSKKKRLPTVKRHPKEACDTNYAFASFGMNFNANVPPGQNVGKHTPQKSGGLGQLVISALYLVYTIAEADPIRRMLRDDDGTNDDGRTSGRPDRGRKTTAGRTGRTDGQRTWTVTSRQTRRDGRTEEDDDRTHGRTEDDDGDGTNRKGRASKLSNKILRSFVIRHLS